MFKREKVNPAAGCLPMIPTLFVSGRSITLIVTIEMRHTPFFGVDPRHVGARPDLDLGLFG